MFFVCFFALFTNLGLNGQNIILLSQLRDSIALKSDLLYKATYDDERLLINNQLMQFVEKALVQEKSIEYDFDSLRNVSVITSSDKNVRLITWVVPTNEGDFVNYGFVQTFDQSHDAYRVFELVDKGDEIAKPESKTLSASKWLGAIYYRIILEKYKGKKFYTLLGWDGNNRVSRKKIIEVLTVKNNGEPVFGYGIFNAKDLNYVKENSQKRIIFEYSVRNPMRLDYEEQTVHEKISVPVKKKKIKKNKAFIAQQKEVRPEIKERVFKSELIIFHRLSPPNKEVEGVYSFYQTEDNILDCLVFTNGKWKFYQDIDARNPSPDKTKHEIQKKINYNLY